MRVQETHQLGVAFGAGQVFGSKKHGDEAAPTGIGFVLFGALRVVVMLPDAAQQIEAVALRPELIIERIGAFLLAVALERFGAEASEHIGQCRGGLHEGLGTVEEGEGTAAIVGATQGGSEQ